jgi:hypothetical protein
MQQIVELFDQEQTVLVKAATNTLCVSTPGTILDGVRSRDVSSTVQVISTSVRDPSSLGPAS